MEPHAPLEKRLEHVLGHLGVTRAHVGASMAADWRGLAYKQPDLFASLTLVCPTAVDRTDLAATASRCLVFSGDRGAQPERLSRALAGVPGAKLVTLSEYLGETWADVVADRTHDIGLAMRDFLEQVDEDAPLPALNLREGDGEVAGISYRVRGSGPPIVLFPLQLAASQWEPLLPELATRYCTIVLGGAALGIVAYLEERGRLGYLTAVKSLMDAIRLRPGEVVLEVGVGSGVLSRWLAHHTSRTNPIIGVDLNPYLLREAAALISKEDLGGTVTLHEANAEALPFPDASVDVAFACTVLEEGNADRMLAEMVRVTRPQGRVGIIVRATDMPWWVNLPLPAALKTKVQTPGLAGSGVGPGGCGDATLYGRVHRAGLTELTLFPYLVPVTKVDPRFTMFQQQYLGALTSEEADEWRKAAAQADAEETFFLGQPFHCAVGVKA